MPEQTEKQAFTFSLSRLIANLCIAGLILCAVWMGGGMGIFLNIPAVMLTLGVTFFLLLATYGEDFVRFVPDAALTFLGLSTGPNARFADIARSGSRFVIGAGAIATVIGYVKMLATLDDPSQIGMGMAVAMLAILYALLLSEIVFAFLYEAYRPRDGDEQPSPLPYRSVGIGAAVVGMLMILFLMLLGTFAVI